MLELYCLPLGATKRHDFVATLLADCGAKGNAKALVLPSALLLEDARRQARHCGRDSHLKLNILAFDELVALLVRQLDLRIRLLDRMAQELLVGEILQELEQEGQLRYFTQIAGFPGYISTVTQLLGEIKRSALPPNELAAVVEALDAPHKDREIELIYHRYQQKLAELKLADLEEMYFIALQGLNEGTIKMPYRTLLFSEFYDLTPLQLAIIRACRATTDIIIGLIYEKNRPELYQAVEATYTELVGMGFNPHFLSPAVPARPSLIHLRTQLFRLEVPLMPKGEGIVVNACGSRAQEVAVVAREVKKLLLNGFKPEEILLVARNIDNYQDLAAKFDELAIPLALPQVRYLSERPVARLVINCLRARQVGAKRSLLRNLIKSPYVRQLLPFDADFVDQVLVNNIGTDWSDWLVHMDRAQATYERERQQGRQVLGWLESRINSLPLVATCGQFTAAVSGLLAEFAVPRQLGEAYRAGDITLAMLQEELVAYDRLLKLLAEMEESFALVGQDRRVLNIADLTEHLLKAMGSERLSHTVPPANAVRVATPDAVRGLSYRAVFILGLSEGEFPRHERENWLYNDSERQLLRELGVALMTRQESRAREDLFFAAAVATASEYLILSFYEDSETLPSPYIAAVTRLFAEFTKNTYSVSQVFAASYEDVYSLNELQCKALADIAAGQRSEERRVGRYALASLPDRDFWRRVRAQEGRLQGTRDQYNGILGSHALALLTERLGENAVFSITAITDYATCPFRYFAARILNLEEWAEAEEDTDHSVLGTLYHATLARFLAAHRGERLSKQEQAAYESELQAHMQAVCDQLMERGKIIDGPLWQLERSRAWQVLKRWLVFELEQQSDDLGFAPRYLEWGFGLPKASDMDPASVDSPLVFPGVDGRTVALRGKVDRIDCCGNKFVVYDYKKRRMPPSGEIEKGLDLQIPLYILAVEQHLVATTGQVIGGGYYALEQPGKDGGMWLDEYKDALAHRATKRSGNYTAAGWQALLEGIKAAVVQHVDNIRRGVFPVEPKRCPQHCSFAAICRFDPLRAQLSATQAEVNDDD